MSNHELGSLLNEALRRFHAGGVLHLEAHPEVRRVIIDFVNRAKLEYYCNTEEILADLGESLGICEVCTSPTTDLNGGICPACR